MVLGSTDERRSLRMECRLRRFRSILPGEKGGFTPRLKYFPRRKPASGARRTSISLIAFFRIPRPRQAFLIPSPQHRQPAGESPTPPQPLSSCLGGREPGGIHGRGGMASQRRQGFGMIIENPLIHIFGLFPQELQLFLVIFSTTRFVKISRNQFTKCEP